jgi:hypothetical protein
MIIKLAIDTVLHTLLPNASCGVDYFANLRKKEGLKRSQKASVYSQLDG